MKIADLIEFAETRAASLEEGQRIPADDTATLLRLLVAALRNQTAPNPPAPQSSARGGGSGIGVFVASRTFTIPRDTEEIMVSVSGGGGRKQKKS